MQISIRPWHEVDLREIAHLTYVTKEANAKFLGQTSEAAAVERIVKWLREQFAELPRLAVLARSGERLAGWMMLVVQNPTKIGIHPDVRRKGLGRFLMMLLMERATREGFQTMGLSCDVGNTGAIALYRSLGGQEEDAEIKYAVKLQPLSASETERNLA